MPEILLEHIPQAYVPRLAELSPTLPVGNTLVSEPMIQPLAQPKVAEEIHVDLTQFNSVQAHSGDMGSLLKEAIVNGKPIGCPFLQSLGAKGIELAQKWVAEDKNPNKNLSLDELIAQRKAQEQTTSPTMKNDHEAKAKQPKVEVPIQAAKVKGALESVLPFIAPREVEPRQKSEFIAAIQNQAQQSAGLVNAQRLEPVLKSEAFKPVGAKLPEPANIAPSSVTTAHPKTEPIRRKPEKSRGVLPIKTTIPLESKPHLADPLPRPLYKSIPEADATEKSPPETIGTAIPKPRRQAIKVVPSHFDITIDHNSMAADSANIKPTLDLPLLPYKDNAVVTHAVQPELSAAGDTAQAENVIELSNYEGIAISEDDNEPNFALWENELSSVFDESMETAQRYVDNGTVLDTTEGNTVAEELNSSVITLENAEIDFVPELDHLAAEDLFLQSSGLGPIHFAEEFITYEPKPAEILNESKDNMNILNILAICFEEPTEIKSKIASLEPLKFEATTEVFKAIVDTLQNSLELSETLFAESMAHDQKLQQQCIELFTLIGVSVDHDTTLRLIQNIRVALIAANISFPTTIHELSRVGTHEHKFMHRLSPVRLARIIQYALRRQLRVGQYVLHVSIV